MSEIILYDYWRSSASYRVRIALGLLGLSFTPVPVNLRQDEQASDTHRARNPQGFVPVLVVNGETLTQSLAIIEYLDTQYAPGTLLPTDPKKRFHAQQIAYAIAMDIHPVCNPKVVNYFLNHADDTAANRLEWMQKFIGEGLDALETMVEPVAGEYAIGDTPSIADCCLVPQLYNARRWELSPERWPHLTAIDHRCQALAAFSNASPENNASNPKS